MGISKHTKALQPGANTPSAKTPSAKTPSAKTPMIIRFSTVAGELGAGDAERDVRGFALKAQNPEAMMVPYATTRRRSQHTIGVRHGRKD